MVLSPVFALLSKVLFSSPYFRGEEKEKSRGNETEDRARFSQNQCIKFIYGRA